jgi:hypothetical protein
MHNVQLAPANSLPDRRCAASQLPPQACSAAAPAGRTRRDLPHTNAPPLTRPNPRRHSSATNPERPTPPPPRQTPPDATARDTTKAAVPGDARSGSSDRLPLPRSRTVIRGREHQPWRPPPAPHNSPAIALGSKSGLFLLSATIRGMELVRPAMPYLDSYVDALRRGWSPDNVRGIAAAQDELRRIECNPAEFVESLTDPDAKGPPVTLADGSQVPRLPGFHLWMWDGEFCGSIGLRWQPRTSLLPPTCPLRSFRYSHSILSSQA